MLLLFTLQMPADDLAELQKLYDRFRDEMILEARLHLSSQADAEDVVHDVFCTLALKPALRLAEKGEPLLHRFLLVCARNRAMSHERRMKRLKLMPTPEAPKAGAYADDPIVERMEQKELLRKLGKAMKKLDPLSADVLYFRMQGHSIAETAELFGEKPETIKKRLHRARQQLRKVLEKEGGTE